MKLFIKKFLILLTLLFTQSNLSADIPHYVDFKLILNESTAGKKAQDFLKNKLENGLKKFLIKKKLWKKKKLIQQKKLLKPDEYKTKVNSQGQKLSIYKRKEVNLFNQS